MKCRAAILRTTGAEKPYAESQPLSIEEIELDPPGPNEVLVKIAGAGVCHSDLSVINGSRARPLPIVLGHEGSGEIVEIGSAITDLKEGDHTVFQFSAACGRCVRCLEGRPQNCFTAATQGGKGELMGGGSRIRDADGNTIGHHSGISCMAEYAVMDRGSIIVVDKSVPLADAALFGCAVMTGAGAVINTARVRSGDKVAVLGLGGVGLNGVMGAKLAGAGEIIAIDTDARKLELAKELGATQVINGTDNDVVEQVKDLTGGGVDFAVELAGTIPAMETAYAIIARGGAVVTAGLSPAGAQFSFEHADLVSNEKSVLGSYMGSCVPVRDIPRFIHAFQQGDMPVDRLIDRHIGLDELNDGFDLLDRGDTVRQILAPHEFN